MTDQGTQASSEKASDTRNKKCIHLVYQVENLGKEDVFVKHGYPRRLGYVRLLFYAVSATMAI